MEQNSEKKSQWGGAREGSGRKKKYAKTCFFNATEEVVAIIEAVPRSARADFINQAILRAASGAESQYPSTPGGDTKHIS